MPAPSETSAAPAGRKENVFAGVMWMLVSGLMFVSMTGIVRYLGSSLPPAEGAFIRYVIGTLFVAPALIGVLRNLPERKVLRLYGARGLVHGLGVILWFYAMARIPVAEVTALGYLAPIITTVLAAMFLGEALRIRRIMAVFVGLIGVAVIIRPGFQEIGPGQIAQISTAPLFAFSFVFAKLLTRTEKPAAIVAMLSLSCTLTLLPFALADWRTPTFEEVGWLAVVAMFATSGHYMLTKAYQCAPITVTQPVTFLQLVWATALGAIAFDEPVDIYIVIGAVLIVGSAWYIAVREMARKKPPQGGA